MTGTNTSLVWWYQSDVWYNHKLGVVVPARCLVWYKHKLGVVLPAR